MLRPERLGRLADHIGGSGAAAPAPAAAAPAEPGNDELLSAVGLDAAVYLANRLTDGERAAFERDGSAPFRTTAPCPSLVGAPSCSWGSQR